MIFESKLRELGARMFGEPATDPEKQVCAIEHELEFRFPEEYRLFLLDYGCAMLLGPDVVYRPLESSPFADENGRQDVGLLYGPIEGTSGLRLNNQWLCNQIPPHVITIGDQCFGDQVCLAIVGPDRGKVFYWYHEDPDELRIYLIARSFSEFIDMLEIDPDQPSGQNGPDE
jgi:hypothetical protein